MQERGKIRHREHATVINDFSGLRLKNITPTDIDGFIEYQNKAMIFFELKYMSAPLPFGQRLALERLVDISAENRPSILFIAEYSELNAHGDVDSSMCVVREYRYKKKWTKPKRDYTLSVAIHKFLKL